MKLPRRQFLHLAVGAAVMPTVPRFGWAQTYPSRPVRIVVGFAPGASPDITARILGQWLSERLGKQFIVENRPGAGTNLATEAVVKAQPDGYTLLWVGTSNTISRSFYANLNFDIVRDIEPVGSFLSVPLVMLIDPSVPAATIPEFITYAKANPGKLNMGSAGNGSSSHVAGELFKLMTGVDMLHVPYRGNPLPDLLGGQVQVYFAATTQSVEVVRANKVRALGVTAPTRSEVLPDIPALSEFVPGYEASTWQGIGAPKNTPIDIVSRLHKEINMALGDPKIRTRLGDLGGAPFPGSPAEFGRHIVEESEKWGRVLKFAGIKPE
jgi:tripartite-type tricarboxylate transporter receptor subunit TctC